MIRAALNKLGVDNSNSVKFVAIPFPAMRTALNAGQVDAIRAPEPFMTQALNLDGDRIVVAPGPTIGQYWPNGMYVALQDWVKENPALARGFHDAMNESLLTRRRTRRRFGRCCRRRSGTSGCRSGAR